MKKYGVAVEWRIEERDGPGDARSVGRRIELFFTRPGQRARQKLLDRVSIGELARRVAAISHPKRVAIVQAILTGAANHRELSQRTTIKTGPLYFHLRHLERAGLIIVHQRERYEPTVLCQMLMFLLAAVLSDGGGGRKSR